MCKKFGFYIAAIVGMILTILSTLALLYFPVLLSNKIKEKIPLVPGSESLERWSNIKVPISMKFFIFEVINYEEVSKGLGKPRLVERGPYVFDEKRRKEVISYTNTTLCYKQFKSFVFNADKSRGTLEDKFMMINIPAIVMSTMVANKLKNSPLKPIVFPILEKLITGDGQNLFTKRTVREVLFDGYQISFLARLKEELNRYDISLKLQDRFGFFLGKNGTDDGEYCIDNGKGDPNDFTKIHSWNAKQKVNFWKKDSICNHVNGTDGSQFHPGVQRTDKLFIFSGELCRSIYIEYLGDSEIRGIPTFKFGLPKELFLSSLKHPDNECFCSNKQDPLCTYDGVMDASPCKKGAPIALSLPHFYGADRRLLKSVVGLKPDKSIHETYLNIEPNTGLVFDASQRLQINLNLRSVPEVQILKDIDDVILPILWLEESATIDKGSAAQFKSKITNTVLIAHSVLVSAIFLGILLILSALTIIVWKRFDFPSFQGYDAPSDKPEKIGS